MNINLKYTKFQQNCQRQSFDKLSIVSAQQANIHKRKINNHQNNLYQIHFIQHQNQHKVRNTMEPVKNSHQFTFRNNNGIGLENKNRNQVQSQKEFGCRKVRGSSPTPFIYKNFGFNKQNLEHQQSQSHQQFQHKLSFNQNCHRNNQNNLNNLNSQNNLNNQNINPKNLSISNNNYSQSLIKKIQFNQQSQPIFLKYMQSPDFININNSNNLNYRHKIGIQSQQQFQSNYQIKIQAQTQTQTQHQTLKNSPSTHYTYFYPNHSKTPKHNRSPTGQIKTQQFFYKHNQRTKNNKRYSNLIDSSNQKQIPEKFRFSKPIQSVKRIHQSEEPLYLKKVPEFLNKNKKGQKDIQVQNSKKQLKSLLHFTYKVPRKFKKNQIDSNKSINDQNKSENIIQNQSDKDRRLSYQQFNKRLPSRKFFEQFSKEKQNNKQSGEGEQGIYRISSLSNFTKVSLESTQDLDKPLKKINLLTYFKKQENSIASQEKPELFQINKVSPLLPIEEQTIKSSILGVKKSICSKDQQMRLSQQLSFLFQSDCTQSNNTSRIEQYWNQFQDVLFSSKNN